MNTNTLDAAHTFAVENGYDFQITNGEHAGDTARIESGDIVVYLGGEDTDGVEDGFTWTVHTLDRDEDGDLVEEIVGTTDGDSVTDGDFHTAVAAALTPLFA